MCSLFCVPVCLWHMCKCKWAGTHSTCKPSCPCGTSEKNPQTGMICCVSEKILRGCVQLQLVTWTSCFANDEIPQRQLAGLFVNASNTSEKNPRKVLSPRSISFLAANFWGSSEATPQKRTRGHEWHFPKKTIVLNQCAGPGTILAQSARQQPSKFETEHDWFLSYIDSCARFGQRG